MGWRQRAGPFLPTELKPLQRVVLDGQGRSKLDRLLMLDTLAERLAVLHQQTDRTQSYPSLRGKRILVIEDDPVIAVDYHFQMKHVGAEAQGFKSTNQDALSYLDTHAVDAAIVDFQLCDGTSERIMDGLRQRGIPFVVVSGNLFCMHGETMSEPILAKPVAPGEVCRALSEVLVH